MSIDVLPEFQQFPKIPRFSRECVVTEKIDGTNGCVYVTESGLVIAGSRTRWITPETDNFGFATWVAANAEELRKLGPGRHYGEWWGRGIQRGYGAQDRYFSLFNVSKWGGCADRPACCDVVPVLWAGNFEALQVGEIMMALRLSGSHAARRVGAGAQPAEGIVVYHRAGNCLFKKTFERDEKGKGE